MALRLSEMINLLTITLYGGEGDSLRKQNPKNLRQNLLISTLDHVPSSTV